MDDLKRKWRDLPLRTFFILTVLIGLFVIALLSGLIIWGCAAFRYYLLPDSDSVYLSIQQSYDDGSSSMQSYLLKLDDAPVQLPQIIAQEESPQGIVQMVSPSEFPLSYSIEKIEPSYNRLTPKRKLAYTVCGIIIVAAPTVLSVNHFVQLLFLQAQAKAPSAASLRRNGPNRCPESGLSPELRLRGRDGPPMPFFRTDAGCPLFQQQGNVGHAGGAQKSSGVGITRSAQSYRNHSGICRASGKQGKKRGAVIGKRTAHLPEHRLGR